MAEHDQVGTVIPGRVDEGFCRVGRSRDKNREAIYFPTCKSRLSASTGKSPCHLKNKNPVGVGETYGVRREENR